MSKRTSTDASKITSEADVSTPGIYRFDENGIIYELNYRQFSDFKLSRKPTVTQWHKLLNKFRQKEVKKILP